MTINGTTSITTYFILNRKDRAGKGQPRPFHAVLEQMKKQETEEAKIKQSSSLKGGIIANLPPVAAPAPPPVVALPPRENGYAEPAPPPAQAQPAANRNDARYMSGESIEIPVPAKPVRYEEAPTGHAQNSMPKNKYPDEQYARQSEMMSGQYDPGKSYNRHVERSRACEIL
jgi:hypothetical protein